jgi:hypothetical protein
MFRMIALLLLPAVLIAQERPTFGQTYGGFDPNRKIDGHMVNGVDQYNSGRRAELPQGANRLQLWVVVSPQFRSNPQETKIASWFTGGPNYQPVDQRLAEIRRGCAWNYYYSNNPLFYQSGLMTAVGTATPIVCMTKADGQVIAYMNANTLSRMSSPGELADVLVAGIEQANPVPQFDGQVASTQIVRDCPDNNCVPSQTPPATPPRVDGTLQQVVPDTSSNVMPFAFPAIAVLTLIVIGLAVGLAFKSRNQSTLRLSP